LLLTSYLLKLNHQNKKPDKLSKILKSSLKKLNLNQKKVRKIRVSKLQIK